MPGTVLISRIEPDLWSIGPPDAPTVLDSAPALDTIVLEVLGGHLSWSLLSGQRLPAAILHDLTAAQDWLWAIYGASVAVAATDHTEPVELSAEPHLPEIATAARRLAYAHWAARWWPASTLDGIPVLDQRLLDDEIAALTEECELLVDGDDARPSVRESAVVPATARAEDYALAAGAKTGDTRGALTLDRGSGGWDWRRCPPGLVDASERAISWELTRTGGITVVRVRAVAAPGLAGEVPGHLRPHALIDTGDGVIDAELALSGDIWAGVAETHSEVAVRVDIHVPGVGPGAGPAIGPSAGPTTEPSSGPTVGPGVDRPAEPEIRARIRALAAERLRRAAESDTSATDNPADTSHIGDINSTGDTTDTSSTDNGGTDNFGGTGTIGNIDITGDATETSPTGGLGNSTDPGNLAAPDNVTDPGNVVASGNLTDPGDAPLLAEIAAAAQDSDF